MRPLYELLTAIGGLLGLGQIVHTYMAFRTRENEDSDGLVFWLCWWGLFAVIALAIIGMAAIGRVTP